MSLFLPILLPFLAGLAAPWLAGRGNRERLACIAGLLAPLPFLAWTAATGAEGGWLARIELGWLPDLGITFRLAMDGLSAALVALSLVLGAIAVLVSWREIEARSGVFHLLLCWTVATANGVFVAMDLMVFVFFWEAMLIPSFLLIALFGHEAREGAAIKYLIYNGIGGVALLAAVLAMAVLSPSGPTFDPAVIAADPPSPDIQVALLIAFSLALLIKLPALPLHGWLPDAHTQAPTAGSILLAGILLKTGAYGLFRFVPPLFPDAAVTLAPLGMALGVAAALYAGFVACGQRDAKRLVAYTSVAHMGLVLAGIAGGSAMGLTGAAIEMIAHALSASALFLLVGALERRTGTRNLDELGGLQSVAPRFTALFAVFFGAALALPGSANFVGEALVILGTFQVAPVVAMLLLAALVVSVIYATTLLRGVVFGTAPAGTRLPDLEAHEFWPLVVMAGGMLALGLLPQLPIGAVAGAVEAAGAGRLP